jgi:hypothetical protein
MISAINPNVHHFSRQTVLERLLYKEAEISLKVKEFIKNRDVAVTIDTWSSIADEGYCALTVHFINEEWELESLAVNCKPFPGTHTATDMKDKLYEMLRDIGINNDKVVACVTDNEPTMNLFADMLDFPWHGCIDHLIQLLTKVVFDGEGVAACAFTRRHMDTANYIVTPT